MSESKQVKYTGESAVEVRVGNFQGTFAPGEVVEVLEPGFRAELLTREGFELVEGADPATPATPPTTLPTASLTTPTQPPVGAQKPGSDDTKADK